MIHTLLDPILIIKTVGLIGIFFVIFAESGLFFGFFLPGDSLLFTAGILASQNYINIVPLVIGVFICAVLGDSVGYWFGKKVGPKIFTKDDSLFFNKSYIRKAEDFYNRYGNKTIFLARFVPIVRTFAPIIAGVSTMQYKKFIKYNIIGGFVWTFGLVFAGYFLGYVIPKDFDKYLLFIILGIVIVSILPIVYEYIKIKKNF